MPAERIPWMLDAAIEMYGKPRRIRSHNGPEFTCKAFDAWAYERGIEPHFIRPGKPVENGMTKCLNGRSPESFRAELRAPCRPRSSEGPSFTPTPATISPVPDPRTF